MDQPAMQKPESNEDDTLSSVSERKHIIILIFIVFLVIVILLGVTFYFNKKIIRQHENHFQEQQALQVLLAKKAMETNIRGLMREASILALHSLPEFVSGKRDLNSLGELFAGEQAVYSESLAHLFMDAPGHVVQAKSKKTPAGDEANRLAMEWAAEHWSELTVLEHGLLIPSFYVTQKHQMFAMLFPIRVEKSMGGVLAVMVDLKPIIQHYVVPLRSGEYGAGFLIDERGTVVFDHEVEIIGRSIFDGMHARHDELIRVDKRLVSEPSGIDEYSFSVKRGNRVSRKLIVWNAVQVGDHKLVICLSAPDIEINKTLYGLRIQRIISGIFFAVFLVVMSAGFFRIRQKILERSNFLLKDRIRRQTKKLRRSEERLELALKGGDLGLWDWNIQNGQVTFNDRWAEMVGYTFDEIKPHMESWLDLVHPEDKPQVKNKMAAHLEGRIAGFEAEYRILPQTGEWIWISSCGKVMDWDKNGKPLRATGTHLDITRRKRAEEAIQEEKDKKYRTLFNSSVDAISILDGDTCTFVDGNTAALKLYGKEKIEDFIGLSPTRMSPELQPNGRSSHDLAEEYIRAAFKDGAIHFEWIHLDRRGKPFPIRVSLSPMVIGRKKLVIAISRDISDRKKTEEEREKLINELQQALEDVKTLSGLLPICSKCKKIRDDKGYWNNLEGYIERHSEVLFSHGLCSECSDELYGKEDWYIKAKKKRSENGS
ncbi:MAG: PAS domain S-box protein [Desulfobacteraceae bacterium]|nr:PAS domain S-box protein [Desulfobacteraceae bacterium]